MNRLSPPPPQNYSQNYSQNNNNINNSPVREVVKHDISLLLSMKQRQVADLEEKIRSMQSDLTSSDQLRIRWMEKCQHLEMQLVDETAKHTRDLASANQKAVKAKNELEFVWKQQRELENQQALFDASMKGPLLQNDDDDEEVFLEIEEKKKMVLEQQQQQQSENEKRRRNVSATSSPISPTRTTTITAIRNQKTSTSPSPSPGDHHNKNNKNSSPQKTRYNEYNKQFSESPKHSPVSKSGAGPIFEHQVVGSPNNLPQFRDEVNFNNNNNNNNNSNGKMSVNESIIMQQQQQSSSNSINIKQQRNNQSTAVLSSNTDLAGCFTLINNDTTTTTPKLSQNNNVRTSPSKKRGHAKFISPPNNNNTNSSNIQQQQQQQETSTPTRRRNNNISTPNRFSGFIIKNDSFTQTIPPPTFEEISTQVGPAYFIDLVENRTETSMQTEKVVMSSKLLQTEPKKMISREVQVQRRDHEVDDQMKKIKKEMRNLQLQEEKMEWKKQKRRRLAMTTHGSSNSNVGDDDSSNSSNNSDDEFDSGDQENQRRKQKQRESNSNSNSNQTAPSSFWQQALLHSPNNNSCGDEILSASSNNKNNKNNKTSHKFKNSSLLSPPPVAASQQQYADANANRNTEFVAVSPSAVAYSMLTESDPHQLNNNNNSNLSGMKTTTPKNQNSSSFPLSNPNFAVHAPTNSSVEALVIELKATVQILKKDLLESKRINFDLREKLRIVEKAEVTVL